MRRFQEGTLKVRKMLKGVLRTVQSKQYLKGGSNLSFPFPQSLSTKNLKPSSEHNSFYRGYGCLSLPFLSPSLPPSKQHKPLVFKCRGKNKRNKIGIRILRTSERMIFSFAAAFFPYHNFLWRISSQNPLMCPFRDRQNVLTGQFSHKDMASTILTWSTHLTCPAPFLVTRELPTVVQQWWTRMSLAHSDYHFGREVSHAISQWPMIVCHAFSFTPRPAGQGHSVHAPCHQKCHSSMFLYFWLWIKSTGAGLFSRLLIIHTTFSAFTFVNLFCISF